MEYRNNLISQYKTNLPESILNFFLTDFNELKSNSYQEFIAPIISFIDEMELLPAFQKEGLKPQVKDMIGDNFLTIFSKFAFDIKLPKKVTDSLTGQETWTEIMPSNLFITQTNMKTYDQQKGWMLPKQDVKNLKDVLDIWKKINYTTTERQYDCINVAQSDPVYKCENVFHCSDCHSCRNIVFCDGCASCEFTISSQRTANSGFCLRVDDSNSCTNSYNVICSNTISNSFFIQDCNNLHECLFCSHIANKKYCISNMQFEEKEYFMLKMRLLIGS